jgi:CubicO group peptidase (beta-lactamase class C family)
MTKDPFDTATHAELGLMQGFPPPKEKRVDKLNGLWGVPHNRWAYQNMRRLLPSAGIACSNTPIILPRRIDGGIEGLSIRREDGSTADFDTFLRQTFTDSLVVLHRGAIVFERYLNGMTQRQPHQMMSCTKSFVGLFAMIAMHDGRIAEETRIGDVLAEVDNGGAFADATLRQVMDMTNSMTFNEDYADPEADIHTYASIIALGEGAPAGNLHEYLSTLSKNDALPHGEVFNYQTPKTDVLNWVTNRATNTDFVDAMHNQLWARLGTDGEAYMLLDPAGSPVTGGGFNASPGDLARFAAMICADGVFGGAQVVPTEIIETIAEGGSTKAFEKGGMGAGAMADGHWSYRAQWWVRRTSGREAITAIGVNGQWIYIDRDRNIAIIKQSSQPEAESTYFDDYTLNAFDAIIDHLKT